MGARGSISILVATAALVLALVAVAAVDLGGVLIARVRAQTAADAAALAAASALAPVLAQGGNPLNLAEDAASENGARLTRCVCEVGGTTAVVDVEIVAATMFVRAWNGMVVRASATAGLDRDVYSYRG